MSDPAVTFADAERFVIAHFGQAFEGREDFAPTASTDFPSVALTGDDTHLQVELEASPVAYPVVERAQVRVTCWAAPGRRTSVKALASVAAALLSGVSSSAVAGAHVRTGRSAVSTDPTTKNVAVWFLVRVDLLATTLS